MASLSIAAKVYVLVILYKQKIDQLYHEGSSKAISSVALIMYSSTSCFVSNLMLDYTL
jgi:hypothetical protein